MRGKTLHLPEEVKDRTQFPKFLEALESYAARKLKRSSAAMSPLFRNFKQPTLKPPTEPTMRNEAGKYNLAELNEYESRYVFYLDKKHALDGDLVNLFTTMWGQMSQAMKTKLMVKPGYITARQEYDCEWLLKEAKAICAGFEKEQYIFHTAVECLRRFMETKQNDGEELVDFRKRFDEAGETIDHHGIEVFGGDSLREYVIDHCGVSASDEDAIRNAIRDRGMAVAFLEALNPKRHPGIVLALMNSTLFDDGAGSRHNKFPASVPEAYEMVLKYKDTPEVQDLEEVDDNISVDTEESGEYDTDDESGEHDTDDESSEEYDTDDESGEEYDTDYDTGDYETDDGTRIESTDDESSVEHHQAISDDEYGDEETHAECNNGRVDHELSLERQDEAEEDTVDGLGSSLDERPLAAARDHGLRPSRETDYSHRYPSTHFLGLQMFVGLHMEMDTPELKGAEESLKNSGATLQGNEREDPHFTTNIENGGGFGTHKGAAAKKTSAEKGATSHENAVLPEPSRELRWTERLQVPSLKNKIQGKGYARQQETLSRLERANMRDNRDASERRHEYYEGSKPRASNDSSHICCKADQFVTDDVRSGTASHHQASALFAGATPRNGGELAEALVFNTGATVKGHEVENPRNKGAGSPTASFQNHGFDDSSQQIELYKLEEMDNGRAHMIQDLRDADGHNIYTYTGNDETESDDDGVDEADDDKKAAEKDAVFHAAPRNTSYYRNSVAGGATHVNVLSFFSDLQQCHVEREAALRHQDEPRNEVDEPGISRNANAHNNRDEPTFCYSSRLLQGIDSLRPTNRDEPMFRYSSRLPRNVDSLYPYREIPSYCDEVQRFLALHQRADETDGTEGAADILEMPGAKAHHGSRVTTPSAQTCTVANPV